MRKGDQPLAAEFIRTLLRTTKDSTMLGAYKRFRPYTDGKIRTRLSSATETGRLSSKGDDWWPENSSNLQNVSKRFASLDTLYRVRDIFIPSAGRVLVEGDLKAAEAYATAAFSGDVEVLELLDSGADIHRITASRIFGKDPEAITKEERFLGKIATHALSYGMGWKTFQATVNKDADITGISISAAMAKKVVIGFKNARPKLGTWWGAVEDEVAKTGFLTNPFGRKRRFLSPRQNRNEVIAFLPQSTVADILNHSLVRLYNGYDPTLLEVLLQIHDAILVETEAPGESARVMTEVMESEVRIGNFDVTIPAEITVYPQRWSQESE